MADTTEKTPDTVSVAAHDRVKGERDQAKQQLADATTALADVALRDRAYDHFKANENVPDAYAAARAVTKDVTMRGIADEELPGRLDAWLEEQAAIFGSSVPQETPPEVPESSAAPPGAARPAPSPASGGPQPKPEPLTWSSPEVIRLREQGNRDELIRLVKEGRLLVSPGNPYSRLAPQSG